MELQIYTHGRRDRPTVALTFDDGPNPPVTDQVLEILAQREVRATFFPIGRWVERWPQAFARMVAAGHVIGNHSYRHDRYLGDFDRAEAVLANVTGKPSRSCAPTSSTSTCACSRRWPPRRGSRSSMPTSTRPTSRAPTPTKSSG